MNPTGREQNLNLERSQSPRIGAVIRIKELHLPPSASVCLNPLESGQSFEYEMVYKDDAIYVEVSIPSNRGSHSNTSAVFGVSSKVPVSIPSNRGSHSNRNCRIQPQEDILRLNPLESGQSFEYEHGKQRHDDRERVSIPSNRGSHSNTNAGAAGIGREKEVSIPSNRGSHSNFTC